MSAVARSLAATVLGFAFYYFLALPLILEYAFAGTVAVVALALGLVFAVPRPRRAETVALVLTFLFTLEAVGRLGDQPTALRFGGMVFLLLAYPTLARLAAHVPVRRSLPAVIAAGALAGILSPALYPALTEFTPRWVSPPLTGQTKVPFFTPVVADLDGDGRAEIAAVTGTGGTPQTPLTAYGFAYRIFRWDGRRFAEMQAPQGTEPGRRLTRRLAVMIRNDHPAAPALFTAWSGGDPGGLPAFAFRSPVTDPFTAVAQAAAAPGRLPFAALGLTLRTIEASHDAWTAMEQRYGNPADRPELAPLASDRDVLLVARETDVNGDGWPERLINRPDQGAFITEPSRSATPLWEAPNPSFRFEDAGRAGDGREASILAQDKGFWGLDERRYLGAYRLEDTRLARLWKVFVPGIVNPVLADVDGDGRNEIVASLYGTQRIIVLAKHGLPVTAAAWAATLTALLLPLARRLRGANAAGTRPADVTGTRPVDVTGAAVIALAVVVIAGRLPSPALSLASGRPPEPPDAGAQPDPGAARVLAEAVRRMEDVDRYSFQGETLSYVGKRRVPVAFGGVVAPGGMRAYASIWGDTFDAYRRGDLLYLGRKTWHGRAVGTSPPSSLGASLAYLPTLAGNARRLPDTELVARTRCRVYALYPDTAAVKALFPAALAPSPGFWDSGRVPGRFLIKVWVGEKDGLIYQVQTIFDLPLAEAAGLRQKTLLKFANFNDPAAEVKVPEELSTERP